MEILDAETREKLKTIRKIALEKKTYENKFLEEKEIILLLARLLPITNSLYFADVLKNDLLTRPIYQAVADWCDTENGLAAQFPRSILLVANGILPLDNPPASTKKQTCPSP